MSSSNLVNTPVECGIKLSKHDDSEKVDSTLFRSLVRSLRYLTFTRPDKLFGVELVSHYIEAPTTTHLKRCKEDFALHQRYS